MKINYFSFLTLQYIHVVFVTLTPTPGGSHPVYTPLNEIIKIIKCDLNWSQCDLRGPSWGSSTITNRLQVLSDVTFTDRKNFHFGDFYFLIFFKYRHDFNSQGGNHPPSQGSFGPAKDLLEDFLYLHKGGVRILNGIKHFSIDNLSIFTPNDFTQKKSYFRRFSVIFDLLLKIYRIIEFYPKFKFKVFSGFLRIR